MRRRTALIMLGVAAAACTVAVAAAVAAEHRYVAAHPLDQPFLACFAASVVAIVAMRGLLPEGTGRLLTQTGIGLLGLLVGVAGLIDVEFDDWEPTDPTVVATAPDVSAVSWRHGEPGTAELLLRLRSRDGLLSRDGAADLACFVHWGGGPNAYPEWTYTSAAVTGNTLTVHTADGRPWEVTFDPATLRPTTAKVDRCTGAPGQSS